MQGHNCKGRGITTPTPTPLEEENIPANRSPQQEEENSSTDAKAAVKDHD